ncbi:GNAT family N-acetyltransferase [Calidithermus roseus]|uniref:Acetyltransferase Pat n=1 Tax=Calidithermus roseus TaxID=1644118 RepID=A0A399F407_9DEIN|nr:GNAT family N-acetyltransferase [Calidithermus roseus]RIH89602.1 Acetyltransferase Pat [Calidithermus roseus]
MPDRYYPAPTPQHGLESGPVILKDGRTAFLRQATPADRGLFLDFLSRLSPQARQYRFFSEISPEAAVDLLLKQKPGEERFTLIVLSGDPQRIIATGEFVPEGPGADSAEVAFLVDDWYQGKGLGTLLLERLALIAARRGIRRFHAFTLLENRQMLDVFRSSGFEVHTENEAGEVEVTFELEPSAETVARFEWRDQVATLASLYPFFRPRGVAVVGASRDPQSVGYRVLENLVRNRFAGPVYPVNPAASPAAGEVLVVGSILAYPSVKAIPGPVDLAILTTPPDQVVAAAEACGQRGVRALVVLTIRLERSTTLALVEVCRRYGMRLVGPGSLGLIHTHPEVRLAAGLTPMPEHGNIALSSQSGSLGLAVLEYAREMGLGLSSFVSLGAKADVSSNDLLQFWEDDPQTGLILLYLESFGNPRRFARLARRVGRKKPIVVVRPGRDPVVEALFAQAGVLRAESLEEMFDAAALLAHQPAPAVREDGRHHVALVSNASGPGTLAVEALRTTGLEVTHHDLGSVAGPEEFGQTARQVLQDPQYDSAVALFVPMGFSEPLAVAEALRQALLEARQAGSAKTVLACFMTASRVLFRVGKEQVPVYRFPESAARALGLTVAYARWKSRPTGEFPDFGPDLEAARALLQGRQGELTAEETQRLLELFAIPQAPQAEGLALELEVRHDELFGPVISLSLSDLPLGPQLLAVRITPLSDQDASEMLRALEGKADVAALQELLLRVSQMVEELPALHGVGLELRAGLEGYRVTRAKVELQPLS